jgi:hypothetical protein
MDIGLTMSTGLLTRDERDFFLQRLDPGEMRPVELAEHAERLGYHSVWFSDHVVMGRTATTHHTANVSGTRAYPQRPSPSQRSRHAFSAPTAAPGGLGRDLGRLKDATAQSCSNPWRQGSCLARQGSRQGSCLAIVEAGVGVEAGVVSCDRAGVTGTRRGCLLGRKTRPPRRDPRDRAGVTGTRRGCLFGRKTRPPRRPPRRPRGGTDPTPRRTERRGRSERFTLAPLSTPDWPWPS